MSESIAAVFAVSRFATIPVSGDRGRGVEGYLAPVGFACSVAGEFVQVLIGVSSGRGTRAGEGGGRGRR